MKTLENRVIIFDYNSGREIGEIYSTPNDDGLTPIPSLYDFTFRNQDVSLNNSQTVLLADRQGELFWANYDKAKILQTG
jgi:hypothetical protein